MTSKARRHNRAGRVRSARSLGPFDIIGDVHGCADELIALLASLGYTVRLEGTGDNRRAITTAPTGRRAFFVGDLVDRGPELA